MENNWIDANEQLPEFLPGENYSANVLAWCNDRLMVMCLFWVDGEHCGWASCYGDINGDGEFDDDYRPTHWMPLPTKPKQ